MTGPGLGREELNAARTYPRRIYGTARAAVLPHPRPKPERWNH